jgi:hypothetical protein
MSWSLKPDTSLKIVVGADTVQRARRDGRVTAPCAFVAHVAAGAAEIFDLGYETGRLIGKLVVEGVGSHDVVGVRLPKDEKKKDAKSDEYVVTPCDRGRSRGVAHASPSNRRGAGEGTRRSGPPGRKAS